MGDKIYFMIDQPETEDAAYVRIAENFLSGGHVKYPMLLLREIFWSFS